MNAASRLSKIVYDATPLLYARSDDEVDVRPAEGKWNAREVIGHLIDSASNNHKRFVEAQLGDDLVFHSYDQARWVAAQHYAGAEWSTLVALWSSFNNHLAHVIAAIPDTVLQQHRPQHNFHQIAWRTVPQGEPTTLDYLARDYVGHLEHHLRQIGIEVD